MKTIRRFLHLAATFTWMFVLGAVPTGAQSVLTTDQLFDAANMAWYNRDYVRSYAYLEAFFQRDPASLSHQEFRGKMQEWYRNAYYNAANPTSIASSGSGTSQGVGSTGQGLAFGPPSTLPAAPTSYRMRCTGGGQMTAHYYPFPSKHMLSLNFAKSAFAAGDSWPAPGQCAWIDRPIYATEPSWMIMEFDPIEMAISRITFGSHDGVAGAGLPRGSPPGIIARIMTVNGDTLDRLLNSIHAGRHFEVKAYNNRGGQFTVADIVWQGQ